VKAKIERAFLAPLRNPEVYKSFGREIRGGLVLFGPPGCGKTFIARALAGEIGARFFDVGLSDVLDMWFGESEQKLHALFENARRSPPAVLFLDEVDALGHRRSQLKGSAGRTLVNQLLAELDGFGARSTGVFVLGATNHPWDLDPALRRPGRFDQLVFVPPPDAPARRAILELKLAGRPVAPGLDLAEAVAATEGFSGADLQALVDHATDTAIERSMRDGRQFPIDAAALVAAARGLKPSARAWLETSRDYAVYANEGGMLDDLLAYLKQVGLA
jgi:SpoVK/Ycf46/Vps4 family AAA+-type ATPase